MTPRTGPTRTLSPMTRRLVYLACMAVAIVAGGYGLITDAAVANIGTILTGVLAPGLAIGYLSDDGRH